MLVKWGGDPADAHTGGGRSRAGLAPVAVMSDGHRRRDRVLRRPTTTAEQVSGQDKSDLLMALTGAFNSLELRVCSANITSNEAGRVLDVFRVTDMDDEKVHSHPSPVCLVHENVLSTKAPLRKDAWQGEAAHRFSGRTKCPAADCATLVSCCAQPTSGGAG